jgi:hypothetical protein
MKDYSEHQPIEKGMVSFFAERKRVHAKGVYNMASWPSMQKRSPFCSISSNKRDEKATGYQPI